MIAAIVRWLPFSLALHSAALGATLLLPRASALSPLFVDLTLTEAIAPPADAPGAVARGPRAERAATPSRRAATASPAPRTTPALASAAAPPPPSEPPRPSVAPAPSVPAPSVTPAPSVPAPEPAVVAPPPAIPPAPPPTASDSSQAWPVPTSAPDASASTGSTSAASGGAAASSRSAAANGAGDGPIQTPGDDARGGSSTGGGTAGAGQTLALGIGGGDGAGEYAGYIALLRRRVQEALSYPSAARRRGMSGTVHLDISVEPTGKIADVLVVRSSSYEVLDTAALDAVRALRHVPFPPGVRPRAVRVRLPVVFELR